eukprot:Nitzschia sp. Nitz4//scaffold104_size75438//16163//18652//NITZ4_005653-RA/size75438-processed-gene-0.73-mRNA-1//-1//CDS//3329532377//943//frame0
MDQLQQGLQNTTHLLAPMALPNPHKAFRQPSKYTWSPDSITTTTTTTTIPKKNHKQEYRQGIVVPIQVPRRHLDHAEEWLWETLLPLYNVLAMFGWNHMDPNEINLQLVLLEGGNHGEEGDDDMWCNATCIQPLRRLFQQWMGYSLLSLHQQQHVARKNDYSTFEPTTICWSHAAAGMGLLSAKGLSQQGHHVKDYSPFRIHNVGKGNLFWQLRQHIVQQQSAGGTTGRNPMVTRHCVWAVPQGVGLSPPSDGSFSTLFPSIGPSNNNTTHLIHTATHSQLWVALANETSWTWPAFFMPPGSTLVLLHDETTRPQGSSPDSHPTMVQFDLWNHMTHLQVHWIALQHNSSDLLAWLNALVPPSNSAGASLSAITMAKDKDLPVPPANMSLAFHGHKLTWGPPQPSSVHCIGHNWEWDTHNYHSCRLQNMCWNTQTQTFHITANHTSTGSTTNNSTLAWRSWDFHSTHAQNQQVMMGQTVRLGSGEPWFPSVSHEMMHESSMAWLPKDVVWLPYFAQVPNSNNPGHLLWDYFFPFFVLVDLFLSPETTTENVQLLLTHLDSECVSPSPCYTLTRKFLPLLGVDPDSFGNPRHRGDDPALPTWICSHETLVGIGMLTDHGFKKHGQLLEDYQNVWNAGRGTSFWRFRNFMWDQFVRTNHHTPIPPLERPAPFRITFSINSSVNPSRRRDFATHIQQLQTSLEHEPAIGGDYAITPVELAKHSMAEQLQLMNETAIFVSVVGGSASTATLLNRNAVVILFYNDIDDWVKTKPHERRSRQAMPAMLDWDFWNHASYLRVHWLPISTMEEILGIETFVQLAREELVSMAAFTSGP